MSEEGEPRIDRMLDRRFMVCWGVVDPSCWPLSDTRDVRFLIAGVEGELLSCRRGESDPGDEPAVGRKSIDEALRESREGVSFFAELSWDVPDDDECGALRESEEKDLVNESGTEFFREPGAGGCKGSRRLSMATTQENFT